MTDGWDLVLIGAVLIGYAVFSRRLAGSPVTAAIVFVIAGVLPLAIILGTVGGRLSETSQVAEPRKLRREHERDPLDHRG